MTTLQHVFLLLGSFYGGNYFLQTTLENFTTKKVTKGNKAFFKHFLLQSHSTSLSFSQHLNSAKFISEDLQLRADLSIVGYDTNCEVEIPTQSKNVVIQKHLEFKSYCFSFSNECVNHFCYLIMIDKWYCWHYKTHHFVFFY